MKYPSCFKPHVTETTTTKTLLDQINDCHNLAKEKKNNYLSYSRLLHHKRTSLQSEEPVAVTKAMVVFFFHISGG